MKAISTIALEQEVDERGADGRERQDLAREVHLLHEVRVLDDRPRGERSASR
jgi:hypothetical protein